MSKKMVNGLLGLVQGIAMILGLKWAVEITDHKLKLKFVDPDEKKVREFNENHYVNGNIYLKGYANPLKLEKLADGVELISSDRYKGYMKAEVAKGIMNINPTGWTTKKLILVVLVLTAINTSVIGLFMLMLFGGL